MILPIERVLVGDDRVVDLGVDLGVAQSDAHLLCPRLTGNDPGEERFTAMSERADAERIAVVRPQSWHSDEPGIVVVAEVDAESSDCWARVSHRDAYVVNVTNPLKLWRRRHASGE